MKALRNINSVSGFLALIAFIIMLAAIYLQKKCLLYYISGGVFLVFGVIFAVTAVVFMVRSIVWHVETKRLRYLIRHYIYAMLAAYVAMMILDHVTVGKIGWTSNLMYALVIALGEVYASGYRLRIKKKSPPETTA